MTTTIRFIGLPGNVKFTAFKHELDQQNGKPRWRVTGQVYSGADEWLEIVWCDSEEHALLAVLFLSEGGHVKINGNVITDDLAMPRRHKAGD